MAPSRERDGLWIGPDPWFGDAPAWSQWPMRVQRRPSSGASPEGGSTVGSHVTEKGYHQGRLPAGVIAVLTRWIDKRHSLGIDGRAPLFCALAGRPIKPSYVRTLLPRLAARTGIEKRVHPQGLRHTHAFELMLEGVPVAIIQAQLGGTSLATTSRYVSHLAPVDVIGRMKARGWTLWGDRVHCSCRSQCIVDLLVD